jgi:hypothetical protein
LKTPTTHSRTLLSRAARNLQNFGRGDEHSHVAGFESYRTKIAGDYPKNITEAMQVHLALLAAAKSDVAMPTLQASIYRDLAAQDQGIAAAKMSGPDIYGAENILNGRKDDPTTAKNFDRKSRKPRSS